MKNEIIDGEIRQRPIKKGRVVRKIGFPEANSAFKMGIVAAALAFFLAGFVVGVFALLKARKAEKILNENYERYKKEKWKISLGKVLGWIGVGVGGFFAIIVIVSMIIDASKPMQEREFFKEKSYSEEYYEEY